MFNCSRVISVVLLLVQSPTTAAADMIAHACRAVSSDAYSVEVIQRDRGGPCVGFVVKDRAGAEVQRVENGYVGSGTVVVSQDGRVAMFINDYAYGTLRKGVLEPYGIKPEERALWVAVAFFESGKRLGAHTFEELIVRPRFVDLSTSHFRWVNGRIDHPLGDEVSLTTTSFRQVVFHTRTGQIKKAEDTAQWKGCEAIAYGDVREEGGHFLMSPAYPGKGELPNPLPLTFAKTLRPQTGYQMLCFTRRAKGWEAVASLPAVNGLSSP
jgi:hypothetical protein